MRRVLALLVVLTTLYPGAALAQEKGEEPKAHVHGYVFGDYFYKAAGDTGGATQYSALAKTFQAFQIRRAYLYLDHPISETFSAQFLLEANDKATDPGGRHGVFVKTAYLEWKELVPQGSLLLGMVPTPTWSLLSEKVWGYRSIEKTITDFRGLGAASDIGVLLKGTLGGAGKVGYNVVVGNGRGQKPEDDKYKKYYAGVHAKPAENVIVEVYGDFEPAANDKNKTTVKGFAAYQTDRLAVGVEAVRQTQEKAVTDTTGKKLDKGPMGIALFARAPVPGTEKLSAFGRFDFFDPDTKDSDSGFKESFFVLGLDYAPVKNVHVMPNVWVNSYSDKSPSDRERDADVVGRITVFYVYK